LIEAIPNVASAANANDYSAAVDGMLKTLGDPVTHVIRKASRPTASDRETTGRPSDPSWRQLPDGVLVVAITHYSDALDYAAVMKRGGTLREQIRKARAIIFDLRPIVPPTEDEATSVGYIFDLADIPGLLCSTPIFSPGERRRMHDGFPKQRGTTWYESAFYSVQGRRITPARSTPDVPVVFLVNENSQLPAVALALQSAGGAAIVSEGDVGDSVAVTTQRIHLSDGVDAQIRLSELLYQDGTGGLQPDITVAHSTTAGDQNPAFQAALAMAHQFRTIARARTHLPAIPVLGPDDAYAKMSFPPTAYRLLGAFRIWTVIHYFFPYGDLTGEDWDGVLRQYIPRLEKTANALEYNLAVAEMVTHFHDSHGFVSSPVLRDYFGRAPTPVRATMIEGLPVVTRVINEQAAKEAGIAIGDVILKVDGEAAEDRMARLGRYISASTPQSLAREEARYLLRGPDNSTATITVRGRNEEIKELKLPRRLSFVPPAGVTERDGEPYRLLAGNIGYADLDRLTVSMVDEMFEKFKDTKAIIFDDRTYPQGTGYAIAPRLSSNGAVVAAVFQRRIAMFPDAPTADIAGQFASHTFFQRIPFTDKWIYKGKTVMLVDERTQSQAEHIGLFLEAANGTKLIGSPTAGANGDVTNFCVPGDIWITFSGQSVRHADGRQLQRVGLLPDVEVRPTVAGIRAGKDEVLERAIEYLQKELR
jgi:C-terminal processing protease CtpA/Prc